METKRVAIGELEGVVLDWAVGMAAGVDVSLTMAFPSAGVAGLVPWDDDSRKPYRPTMDWRQCGPLIELYRIVVQPVSDDVWEADRRILEGRLRGSWVIKRGPTPLIAACRAIVASHNPDGYVDVPVELLP